MRRGGQCGAGRRGERCCSPPASLVLIISHLDSAVDQVTCARLTDTYESASVQRHCSKGQPDPRKWSRTTVLQNSPEDTSPSAGHAKDGQEIFVSKTRPSPVLALTG
ncbi:uncharacterized protein [Procambarus clarkii]|uniref:uncharacterized protein n=1 Tax=Procambarus clarkii TaxID=6728 RepID=UPI003742A313